jgi:catechol 2,3-dioxygenase-like lactoylglutathione lyase family enzyme
MPFHHVAIAVNDMPAVDAFYSRAMGFRLVKVNVGPTPEGGWAKHFFYDIGDGELMAFWDIQDDKLGKDYKTAISMDMGLPPWANHLAFNASDHEDLEQHKERMLDAGYDVIRIEHDFCTSIYTLDPNRILVEFCCTDKEFNEEDRSRALSALWSNELENDAAPKVEHFKSPNEPVHQAVQPPSPPSTDT